MRFYKKTKEDEPYFKITRVIGMVPLTMNHINGVGRELTRDFDINPDHLVIRIVNPHGSYPDHLLYVHHIHPTATRDKKLQKNISYLKVIKKSITISK